MTLRARILLVLVGVVAAGLVIVDVVTYTSLRSFLISRTQPQLVAAAERTEFTLLSLNGMQPPRPFGSHHFPRPAGFAPTGTPSSTGTSTSGRINRFEFLAPGTFGELIGSDGKVFGKTTLSLPGSTSRPPVLPTRLPKPGTDNQSIFTASSKGANAVSYQVLARPLSADHLTLIVALPLTDVDQTLGHLRLVLLLVSIAVLIGLGALGWLIVRRGLRPLEDMAEAAGDIAAGDLTRRVSPDDGRTEVGRLGQALNGMLHDIEEAFAARAASELRLRRFLADASHELRTPLTSIRGHAELFELGAKERPEDLAMSMRHIREEADRMNLMVNDLLLLARLDQERPIHLETTDVVPLVRKSVTAIQVVDHERAVIVHAPDSALVMCDAERIRQVLDNLVANAVRHSPPQSPIEVTVRVDDGVTVEVRDRGPGVPPDEAAQIFEPFYRSDFSRARVSGGTGLGLAIVAAIVRAHGGQVGVRDNPGGGACFWLALPAHRSALGATAARDEHPTPPAPGQPPASDGSPPVDPARVPSQRPDSAARA